MDVDILIIGAGIAGTSLAAHLAPSAKVLLIEAESHAGYHATGRSAALFSEIYGGPIVRSLSRASRAFFDACDESFAPDPLLSPRGTLFLASNESLERLDRFAALPDIRAATTVIDRDQAMALCPILRPEAIRSALLETASSDIDVHALLQGYIRRIRQANGTIVSDRRVTSLRHAQGKWIASAGEESFAAPILVNAAGAWADQIAVMAGIPPVGLVPKRRTIANVAAPDGHDVRSWPLVIDIDETFYIKPDAGTLLLSPADETPIEPCDAHPTEWDIAVAIDRVHAFAKLDVRHVKHSWAGLRSFVADKEPVAGFAAQADGFFWLAGQGGYGIQTAPALAELSASVILGTSPPAHLAEAGVTAEMLLPERLAAFSRSMETVS
jgi:D-arginine dehydrogenase